MTTSRDPPIHHSILTQQEINRRLCKIYEMALQAAARANQASVSPPPAKASVLDLAIGEQTLLVSPHLGE
jgi:hypothetical protein